MTAIEQFNDVFGFHFREPVDGHTLGVMIGFARESGAVEIAEALAREAGGCEDVPVATLAEHNAFPGGRW